MPVVSAENSEHYTWGERCSGWHLLKSSAISVIEELMPPGTSEKRHYHASAEQFFYVLAGTLTIELEGFESEVRRFEGLHIAAGKSHLVRNASTSDARFLLVSSPPAQGDRIPCEND
ncbi:MAG: cupin domain-containing protein [Planctomycetales bacterium]|nr:cupin domain-containing protein [Planctomycetales bacterium]